VVIDPFYYLDYEANTSRTTGGDAANTSVKLRALAGRTRTVIHAITQADEDGQKSDADRELDAPARKDVLKTKALLQDAANLFAIDTMDGQGIIQLGKGRQGGEGATVEVTYLPNYGVVKETGDELAAMAAMLGY
jgi:replicative DNA helicase